MYSYRQILEDHSKSRDVWQTICQFADLKTLISMSRVSKQFYQVASHVLDKNPEALIKCIDQIDHHIAKKLGSKFLELKSELKEYKEKLNYQNTMLKDFFSPCIYLKLSHCHGKNFKKYPSWPYTLGLTLMSVGTIGLCASQLLKWSLSDDDYRAMAGSSSAALGLGFLICVLYCVYGKPVKKSIALSKGPFIRLLKDRAKDFFAVQSKSLFAQRYQFFSAYTKAIDERQKMDSSIFKEDTASQIPPLSKGLLILMINMYFILKQRESWQKEWEEMFHYHLNITKNYPDPDESINTEFTNHINIYQKAVNPPIKNKDEVIIDMKI